MDGRFPPPSSLARMGVESAPFEVEVDEEDAGTRLDRFLADRLADHSRTAIQRSIQEGGATVNGVVVTKRAHPIEAGDTVRFLPPAARSTEVAAEPVPFDVIHEDASICVVAKPSGIATHPGAGVAGGTLVNGLVRHFRELSGVAGSDRPGIVHRLDRGTSGLLVVARTDAAHHRLSEQFAVRTVKKEYVAIAIGRIQLDSDWIEAPIGREPNHRERMAIREDGRDAATFYRVEERFRKHTLVRLFPKTGRTHQLRVHLRHLGHPIAGDALYGRPDHSGLPVERLLLHAEVLEFDHPDDGARVRFVAPLPADFERALAWLAENRSSS